MRRVSATLDTYQLVPVGENRASWRNAEMHPYVCRAPSGGPHLLFGELLSGREMHVLDAACNLIRPAMSETEIVPARKECDVTFSVRGGLDGEALTTEDVSELLKVSARPSTLATTGM